MSPKKCSTATKCSARTGRQSGPSQRETAEQNSRGGKERGGDRGSSGLSGASDCTGWRTRISWRATGQWNEDQGGKERRLDRSPEGHRAWWAKARGWAERAPRTGGERVEEYNKLCFTTVVLRLQSKTLFKNRCFCSRVWLGDS